MDTAFDRKFQVTALLVLGAAFFCFKWAADLQRPGVIDQGWKTFNDQGAYYREAKRLSNLESIPEREFAFGPGYPVLAAPFMHFGDGGWPKGDPFFVANLGAWILTLAATHAVATRFMGEAGGALATLLLMFGTPLIEFMTLPWTSTVSLASLMAVAWVAVSRHLRLWHGVVLGLSVGMAFAARYVDALWIGLAVTTVLIARKTLHPKRPVLWGVALGSFVPSAFTLWLHSLAFGTPFETPYSHTNVANAALFDLGNIVPHAFQTFLSPYFFGDKSLIPPLLGRMFLAILAPVGAVLLIRDFRGAARPLIVGFTLTSLLATCFYLAYWFTGTYGIGFGSMHFFKIWWPLWIIAALYALTGLGKTKRLEV